MLFMPEEFFGIIEFSILPLWQLFFQGLLLMQVSRLLLNGCILSRKLQTVRLHFSLSCASVANKSADFNS